MRRKGLSIAEIKASSGASASEATRRERTIVAPTFFESRFLALAFFLLFGAVFFLRAAFHSYFWWDDVSFLLEANSGLASVWHTHEGHFLPSFRIVMILLWRAFGGHYWPYQLTLILAHSLLSFLFYLFLRKESGGSRTAFVLALYFCMSPVCSEEVVWLTMLSQMLMAICFFLALLNWNRGLWPAALLFISFGLFGGGPMLYFPFVFFLFTRPKPFKWGVAFQASLALVAFVVLKACFSPGIPIAMSKVTLGNVLLGIETGLKNAVLLLSIDWSARLFLIAIGAMAVFAAVRGGLRRLLGALPGLVLFCSYCIPAFVYRNNVERRHLYIALLGLLWVVAVSIGDRWSPRVYAAVAGLFAVTCCFDWAFVQKLIDTRYESLGHKGARFTEDYKTALLTGATLYDTALIPEVNSHVLLSEYVPIAGANGRFISDPTSARPPITWIYNPMLRAEHYGRLWQWLKRQPLRSPVREFYSRYYPVGLIYGIP